MNDTLYLHLDRNIQVNHPHIYLQDLASLSCTNSAVLNRLRVLPVLNLNPEEYGRYVMSVMDLVDLIQKKEPDLTITPLGETDFVITYDKGNRGSSFWRICKTAFVSLAAFFGSAFSIMTFNNDVDTGKLFDQIYRQVTGQASQGFTILEISYSLGIGLGVIFFFNHFGPKKITSDPTPMQVQMRLYEDDVNTTITEDIGRTKTEIKWKGR